MSMEMNKALDLLREIRPSIPKEVLELWCKDRDAFLASHPAVDQADVAAKLTFINGRPAMCGCQVEYSDGGGEYSDVIYVTLCAKHSGSAILDLVATNRIALTPEYEGQWHADLYLDREIPLAKVEGATPAEAVLALMSAERIDPEQESVEQAGGDERAAFEAWSGDRFMQDTIHNRTVFGAGYRAALAQPSPVQSEQAEAERPELWAVHAQGPDELYAAFSREDAEKHAAELNALPMPEGIAVGAVVVPSPWPAVQHWQYLAEQEQDHKNEIAGRLRQFERICEGLPQGAIDGGWTVHGIRGYAKRLEDQLKAALARVAELEGKLTDWVHEGFRLNEALAVAKAQHSVPIAPELKRALALVVAALEADGDRPTSKYALSELKKVLAAAHVCHLSRNALTEAQMRRLYENSTETENERLGFEAFARLIRRAEAVHQITAAPGKEVGHD